MNTKTIELNKDKLIKFVESFNNKFISMNVKDGNNFSFYFIPNANFYKKAELDEISEKVRAGLDLTFGSSVRKADVVLNSSNVYADVVYNYPNHLGTVEMDMMAKSFDKFLCGIDAKYKAELKSKLLKDFDNRTNTDDKEM